MSDARHRPELPATSKPIEWSDTRPTPGSSVSKQPTAGAMFNDISALIGAVPVEGPQVVLVACPWLLLALVLAGPFLLLVTTVIVLLAAAC